MFPLFFGHADFLKKKISTFGSLKTSELDLMNQQEHNLDNKVYVKLSHLNFILKAAI